jgi:hypothetical protein
LTSARRVASTPRGGGKYAGSPLSETKPDYEVGPGKPPVHSRFKKDQAGNRADRARKGCRRCWLRLNEKVVATIGEESREITKREAVVSRLVNKSAGADLRATKMLINILKDVEEKAGMTPTHEPAPFTAADEEVMATFIARLRQSWEEELQQRDPEQCPLTSPPPQYVPQAGKHLDGRPPGQAFREGRVWGHGVP